MGGGRLTTDARLFFRFFLCCTRTATSTQNSTATDGDMRILIISGDDDAVCGTRGTELWLTRMG